MSDQPKKLGELREKAHFFVLAPKKFTCGFTEQAIDLLKTSKVRYIVQKVDSLEEFVLPAYPNEPVNVAACLTKSKQIEQDAASTETCSICKHLDCLLEKNGAHLLATRITDGYPQVFAYQPDKGLYAHIGHWGNLEKQFSKWKKSLFPAPAEEVIDAHDMYAQHTDVLNALNSLDAPVKPGEEPVDEKGFGADDFLDEQLPPLHPPQPSLPAADMLGAANRPEEYIGRAPQTYVIDAIDKALFEQWKRETGRIPASWVSSQ